MSTLQRPKGTQDILPDQVATWQHLEAETRQAMAAAGYTEIRTPAFELTELFARGVGEATDIVHKEMYTFERGDRSLTLRPEGTAGVVRAFIENGLSRAPKPVRLWYQGPMFRYERPQAGRQRQFHQVGVEVFGLDTPAVDAEVVLHAVRLFERLGLQGLSLEVNTLGTAEDRTRFGETLRETLAPMAAQLCETCQQRLTRNPLRVLDCKVPSCQARYAGPEVTGLLEAGMAAGESQAHFDAVCALLGRAGVAYRRNARLVRGLDYYTGLVFEVAATTGLGAQNAVCGGGRYNGLVEQLSGPATPAVGWAFGVERVLSLMPPAAPVALDAYLVSDQPAEAFALADTLRAQGLRVEVDVSGKALGKQLGQASKRGARFALILGEAEAAAETVGVKDLATAQQQTLPWAEVAAHLSPVAACPV